MINSNFLSTLKKKIDKLDIHTIKNLISDLIEELEMTKTVFNSMSEGVIVIENDDKIIFINKIALKILEINSNLVLGESIENTIPNNQIKSVIKTAIKNEEKIINYEFRINSEYTEFISLSLYPLVKNGKIIGNVIVIKDISLAKENERKLRHAEGLAAITIISAGIAHEIKNPLGAISIHVQLMEQEMKKCSCSLSEDLKYSLNVVKEEIDRLSEIVNNFLFAVRPLKPDLMLTNYKLFLDKFIALIHPELKSKKIKLLKNYSELSDIWMDEKYFKQALLNLLQNSIASLVNEKNPTIEIDAYIDNNSVITEIIDNGCGIPEENQTKIFDPYFTTKKFGTGLGLTIFYKIIKEHNGDASFTSKPGQTIFYIKLPLPYIDERLIEYNQNIIEE